jgi:iron-sulfur cluster repair protein YtfE (RIC family)
MTWHEGPLQSWYDIHEALRNEFPRLRAMASGLRPDDKDGLATVSDEIAFLSDILTVHSLSEDGVGFPILRHRGIDVPAELSEDHHRELAAVYGIRQACLELRFHDEGQDVSSALDRMHKLLEEMEEDLNGHLDSEDEYLIPQVAARLMPAEQAQLVVKMVAHTPAWLSPRLLPWMLASITREHRVHLLKSWYQTMPSAAFAEKARYIRNGSDPALWNDLVADAPFLAKLD